MALEVGKELPVQVVLHDGVADAVKMVAGIVLRNVPLGLVDAEQVEIVQVFARDDGLLGIIVLDPGRNGPEDTARGRDADVLQGELHLVFEQFPDLLHRVRDPLDVVDLPVQHGPGLVGQGDFRGHVKAVLRLVADGPDDVPSPDVQAEDVVVIGGVFNLPDIRNPVPDRLPVFILLRKLLVIDHD